MSIKDIKCNQLYILDDFGDGKRGCYYLGENGDFYLVEQIKALIQERMQHLHCTKLITAGSSKGGWAALYYGFECKAKCCIVGAPQYYVGDYLNTDEHRPILKAIMGGKTSDIKKLNLVLEEEIGRVRNRDYVAVMCMKITPVLIRIIRMLEYIIKHF